MAAAAVAVLLRPGAWLFLRPAPPGHSMQVRLTGFQRLSPDLPASMPDAMRDEIIAAFREDGVIGVSTASAAPGGGPSYALGGTVRTDGDKVRVITKPDQRALRCDLWSNDYTYDRRGRLASAAPRMAVEAGKHGPLRTLRRVDLPKALPDPVLADYLQACHKRSGRGSDQGPGFRPQGRHRSAEILLGLVCRRKSRLRRDGIAIIRRSGAVFARKRCKRPHAQAESTRPTARRCRSRAC